MTVQKQLTLDDLIVARRSELDEIFLAGATPTLEELAGVVDGRVGALIGVPDVALLKRFINSGWVPWRGKVFETVSPTKGKGINRFRIWPFKFLRFHCATSITGALAGPFDVFTLDYDLAGNPGIIRRVRDDIRKVGHGLFLGSANMRWRGKQRFVAYFMLQSTGLKTRHGSALHFPESRS